MADSSPLKKDPLSGREVIYATHRLDRPHVVATDHDQNKPQKTCPFCPGNEAMLPDILWEQDDEVNWQARAVSNLYPIVSPPDGHHEIIIDAPEHNLSTGAMTAENWRTIVAAYDARLRALSRRWSYVSLFRNVGAPAGGTIDHPHSQLIALAKTPEHINARFQHLLHEYELSGQCLLCEMTNTNPDFAERIITQNAAYVAFSPEVAEVPFEVWVAPLAHSSAFSLADERDQKPLAEILSDVFTRMAVVLGDFDHNMMLVDTSKDQQPYLHWFLRIRPVGEPVGGFERATGIAVNESDPENDATALRHAFAIPDIDSV